MVDDEEIRNREFLGQGWAFPLQFNPRGQIALASGERDIEQAIKLILSTMPGERVMRPTFGCRAWELVFGPMNSETGSQMGHYVTQALRFWEPRIEVNDVDVFRDSNDDGALLVEIQYTVKATHDPRSIVYPFFIVDESNPL
jgi:phage baseplate assembly protein W